LTGGGPQGGRETSCRHCEGCSEWRLGHTGRRDWEAGEVVVKEERRGVDRASLEAYTGAPNPRQTQSSDLLDSPNGVGPIFFASAPSSLALSPLWPVPCTVQDGPRRYRQPSVAATVGLGSRAVGSQTEPTQRTSNPRSVWGTGVSTALPCLAFIHHEDSSSSQREGKVTPLLSVSCLPRVNCFSLNPHFAPRLEILWWNDCRATSKLDSPTIMPWFAHASGQRAPSPMPECPELNHLDHQSLPDVSSCSPSLVCPLDALN
jgi:hypothetical protein